MSDPDSRQTWLASGLKLTADSKLHIPSDIRESAGIEPGDVIDVRILPATDAEDSEAILCLDLIVRSGNYVTVPQYKRRVYGLETDSTVHADIQPTGRTVELD